MNSRKDWDYIGFSFMGIHCSELGFIRVSEGSHYSDSVAPSFSDTTLEVPGMDGVYYWNSEDRAREFSVNIAFDSMSESQLRRFRNIFNGKSYGALIFDETPYKQYFVKLQGVPSLQMVTVMEKGQRVHKGTGTLSFVAHDPMAKSVHKYLSDFNETDYPNKSEWSESSGLLLEKGSYDSPGIVTYVYNAGDVETDVEIYYEIDMIKNNDVLITNKDNGIKIRLVEIKAAEDKYIKINSKTHLIEGVDKDKKRTGSLYGNIITAGDFFKLPIGESRIDSTIACAAIEYDHLYY